MQPATNQQGRFLYGLPFWNWLVYRLAWLLFALGRWTIFRSRSSGSEELSDSEPYLLLANHNSTLDPLWFAEQLYRPVCPMGSAQMLKAPFIGPLLRTLGCFPKAKFTKDRQAMEKLQTLYDQGFIVMIFPEGTRSLNGKTQQILPGIGKLIKRMKPKVVYGVSHSAFLFMPRWAKYPRFVPIEMQFDGPYTYPEDMTAEELTAEVQQKLHSVPKLSKSGDRVWGWRMAHGLPDCLWACPKCLRNEGLAVDPEDGNAVRCNHCQSHWTIDVECRLSGATETNVADAMETIQAGLGEPPVMDRADFDATGTALRAPNTLLRFWPKGGKPVIHCTGEATLGKDGFTITENGEAGFHAPIDRMHAFSVELGNRFFFRVEQEVYEFLPDEESVYKWKHFLGQWKLAQTGSAY